MKQAHFIVDGMLSGTGIRDGNNGGYIDPSAIGVSFELRARARPLYSGSYPQDLK